MFQIFEVSAQPAAPEFARTLEGAILFVNRRYGVGVRKVADDLWAAAIQGDSTIFIRPETFVEDYPEIEDLYPEGFRAEDEDETGLMPGDVAYGGIVEVSNDSFTCCEVCELNFVGTTCPKCASGRCTYCAEDPQAVGSRLCDGCLEKGRDLAAGDEEEFLAHLEGQNARMSEEPPFDEYDIDPEEAELLRLNEYDPAS